MNTPSATPAEFWQSLCSAEAHRKEQWLDPARVRDMLANDKAMAIEPQPLRPFRVVIGPKDAPRLDFPAMARSSTECFMQHVDLAEPGERFVVLAVGERS